MAVKTDCQTAASAAVPCDWEVRPLSELISIAHGYAFASAYFKESGPYRLTTPGHFFEHGGFRDIGEKQKFYDGPVPAGFVLAEGDLIVAMTEQADGLLGSTAVIPCDGIYLHNQRLGRVAKRRDDVCLEYLFYVFNTPAFRESVRTTAAGTKVKHTSPAKLLAIRIPIPPLLEQQAIARALSDADHLIQSLERMIGKKRALKQSAMQQLLTGQTRLPGFGKQWQQRPLVATAEVSKGEQIAKGSVTAAGTVPYFNGGVSPSGYTHAPNTPANTIAVSEGGNSCGYVNFVTQPFWCGGHCYSIVPRTGLDKRFLYQALKAQQVALMGLRVGSGLPNIQKSVLSAFVLRIPADEDEQAAIAEVLSDMDAEITALEARLAKTCDLKQGMMQELLTGRTRLV